MSDSHDKIGSILKNDEIWPEKTANIFQKHEGGSSGLQDSSLRASGALEGWDVWKFLVSELRENKSSMIFSPHSRFEKRRPPPGEKEKVNPDHLVLFLVNGSCQIEIEGQNAPIQVPVDGLFYLQPGVKFHILDVQSKPLIPMLYQFRFSFEKAGNAELKKPYFFVVPQLGHLLPYMEALLKEFLVDKDGRELRARGLLLFLLGNCQEHLEGRKRTSKIKRSGGNLTTFQCRDLFGYMKNHLSKHVSPMELASCLNLSYPHFARLFQNTFEMTPRHWIIRERIRNAIIALQNPGLNITQIAQKVGYKDVFSFSHQFKKIVGHGPSAFRKLR